MDGELLPEMPAPSKVALIFDLDDTLIESRIDFTAVRHRLIDLLEQAGAAPAPRPDLMTRSLPELAAFGAGVSAEVGTAMWAIIVAAEQEGLARAAVVEHAPDVLRALRGRGFRLALLTNRARENLTERLRELDLDDAFDVLATRDEVPALKPAPDGIRHILARLPAAARVYMIGDAWIDALAAHSAGVRFIGVGPKRPSVDERGIPVWKWIANLRELLELDLTSD